jgi:guanylate kinase
LKSTVERIQKAGKCCILDIDVEGAKSISKCKDMKPFFVFVNVDPPEELKRRLQGRGSETEHQIEVRFNNSKKEIEFRNSDEGKKNFSCRSY